MIITFHKYQGTGNDFIVLDNRKHEYSSLNSDQIRRLCDRRFGIGADGLMMLNEKAGYDFEMKYFNSDGREGSMCGNGGRCLVKFAYHLGIHRNDYKFWAFDSDYEAEIDTDGTVSLKMKNVDKIIKKHGDFILDTGSPHYVKLVNDVMEEDVYKKGRDIRYSKDFEEEGINVNFVEQAGEDEIIVRTYERGVEDENGFNEVEVKTLGGTLSVEFDRVDDDHYTNIWLSGPAEKIFEGKMEVK
jgi:diaminopimelate epimerase